MTGKPRFPFRCFKKILDNVTFSPTKVRVSLTNSFLFSPRSKTDKRVIKNTIRKRLSLKIPKSFFASAARDRGNKRSMCSVHRRREWVITFRHPSPVQLGSKVSSRDSSFSLPPPLSLFPWIDRLFGNAVKSVQRLPRDLR